jgi:Sulfotransferase domain
MCFLPVALHHRWLNFRSATGEISGAKLRWNMALSATRFGERIDPGGAGTAQRLGRTGLDLVKAYTRRDDDVIHCAIGRFDSFCDWPYPLMYRELFERYGETARFILTVRSTPEIWLASYKAHPLRSNPLSNSHRLVYGYDDPHGREAEHLAFYERHNAAVRRFFKARAGRSRLLEICWERGDGWKELCTFLGRPVPAEPLPHAHRGASLAVNPKYQAINVRNVAAQLTSLGRGESA